MAETSSPAMSRLWMSFFSHCRRSSRPMASATATVALLTVLVPNMVLVQSFSSTGQSGVSDVAAGIRSREGGLGLRDLLGDRGDRHADLRFGILPGDRHTAVHRRNCQPLVKRDKQRQLPVEHLLGLADGNLLRPSMLVHDDLHP